jgi:hypothetical protein
VKRLGYLQIMMAICAFAVAANVFADENDYKIDPISELQDAAINFESAASSQQYIANGLLSQLQPKNVQDEETEVRRSRLSQNAAIQMRAANQFIEASKNWDNAARAWESASKAAKETLTSTYFQELFAISNKHATMLIKKAAELMEAAALMYADADDLNGQIQASQKAGKIRLQLSSRL